VCGLIWNETLADSYAYCVYNQGPSEPIRVPAEQLFKEKYVAITPEYYSEIMKWKQDVEKWAKERSKQ
jgi:hypothetical protein